MSETIQQGSTPESPESISQVSPLRSPADMTQEEVAAREKARRYRLRFVDLRTEEPAYNLIHELPVEMMVRHCFVPLGRDGDILYVAMADPRNLDVIDEIEAQLRVRLRTSVATQSAVEEALKRGDTAARILQDATAGFR